MKTISHSFETLILRVQLIVPIRSVGIPRQLVAEQTAKIDVLHMCQADLGGQGGEHLVEVIDQRPHRGGIVPEVEVTAATETGPQPGPGKGSPTALEAATVGHRIIVTVNHHGDVGNFEMLCAQGANAANEGNVGGAQAHVAVGAQRLICRPCRAAEPAGLAANVVGRRGESVHATSPLVVSTPEV